MAKRRNWTNKECRIVIRAYLHMLREQDHGRKFNKAKIARSVLPHLDNRTKGSYEMKLMNISACMEHLGFDVVKGYVPYGHAQKSLTRLIVNQVRDQSFKIVWGG
jgi:hypothetical protein